MMELYLAPISIYAPFAILVGLLVGIALGMYLAHLYSTLLFAFSGGKVAAINPLVGLYLSIFYCFDSKILQ